jgi:hypothetical protein
MNTREEAIDWLTAQHYVAFARDWALGKSIGVAKRQFEVQPGIWAFEPACIFLYPIEDGRWAVVPPTAPSSDVACESLRKAVDYAMHLLESAERRH